jgi:hypothetical protein
LGLATRPYGEVSVVQEKAMLVALEEKVDAVYCPTAVTPVTKVVPLQAAIAGNASPMGAASTLRHARRRA